MNVNNIRQFYESNVQTKINWSFQVNSLINLTASVANGLYDRILMMRTKERVIPTQNHCSLHWLSHCQHISCTVSKKELLLFGSWSNNYIALKSNAPNLWHCNKFLWSKKKQENSNILFLVAISILGMVLNSLNLISYVNYFVTCIEFLNSAVVK